MLHGFLEYAAIMLMIIIGTAFGVVVLFFISAFISALTGHDHLVWFGMLCGLVVLSGIVGALNRR
jgi:hypothetical protein